MSVINDFQVSGLFPSVIGGTAISNTLTYFPRLLGTSIGVQSVAPSSSSAVGQLNVNGNNELNAQWFDVLIGGYVSEPSDPSQSVEVRLYAQTSSTLSSPSYTQIATTGAKSPSGVAQNFGLKVSLLGDTKSGLVHGLYTGVAPDGTLVSLAAVTSLSGISMAQAVPFGLVVGAIVNAADANTKVYLTQFQIFAA